MNWPVTALLASAGVLASVVIAQENSDSAPAVENNATGIMIPSAPEVASMILRHARMLIEYKGEYLGIREMRKHVAWYTAGMKNSAGLRRAVNQVESYEELKRLVYLIED